MKTNYNIFKESLNNNYKRVIPRDFFNESMLLKCLGKLCVAYLHTDEINGLKIEFEEPGEPFNIVLDQNANKLIVTNYKISVNGTVCMFGTEYNSRTNLPLFCMIENMEIPVFKENGEFDEEFIEYFQNR